MPALSNQLDRPWLIRLLAKGVWVLGLLPQVLDFAAAYLPTDAIPQPVLRLLEQGTSWSLTAAFVSVGFLVSAYLVHRDTLAHLRTVETRQALLSLSAVDVVFLHSAPVLTLERRFQDGIKPDGLPIEAIATASIDLENIGQEEGELEWMLDLQASQLPDIFHLFARNTTGTMHDLPNRVPARTRIRLSWRIECGIQEKNPQSFASALANLASFAFVLRYRTLRVGGPTHYSLLSLEGDFQHYRDALADKWTKNGMSDLAALAQGQLAA